MRIRALLVMALFLPAVLMVNGVQAQEELPANCRVLFGEGEDARAVCEEDVYFTCAGDVKIQNVPIIVDGQIPSWDSTPPEQSVTEGAGCGTAETLLTNTGNPRNGHDGVWEGTFTGNLDSMTVEVHKIDTTSRINNTEGLLLWIQIDGVDVVPRTTSAQIEVVGERSPTGASIKFEFSVAGLGFVSEPGTGSFEHHVMVSIRSFANYPGGWVWDTTEVPSGITFNPETPSDNIIAAG